jgi:hypothetical protein
VTELIPKGSKIPVRKNKGFLKHIMIRI